MSLIVPGDNPNNQPWLRSSSPSTHIFPALFWLLRSVSLQLVQNPKQQLGVRGWEQLLLHPAPRVTQMTLPFSPHLGIVPWPLSRGVSRLLSPLCAAIWDLLGALPGIGVGMRAQHVFGRVGSKPWVWSGIGKGALSSHQHFLLYPDKKKKKMN